MNLLHGLVGKCNGWPPIFVGNGKKDHHDAALLIRKYINAIANAPGTLET